MATQARVVKDPTLLDVFAAFVAHAYITRVGGMGEAVEIYDIAEELLAESERRHGHRPQ